MKKKPARKKMSDETLAAYYDSQSEDEMVREIESKNWKSPRLKIKRERARTTSIPLAPETVHRVKALAEAKGVAYQTLLRIWIEERARKEARAS